MKAERERLTDADTRDQLNDRRADSFAINTVFSVFERDSAAGGPVLAGAVAFRVFLFQVPYVFVLVAGLGLASSADHKDPSELARDAGIGGLTAQAIGDLGNISVWRITAPWSAASPVPRRPLGGEGTCIIHCWWAVLVAGHISPASRRHRPVTIAFVGDVRGLVAHRCCRRLVGTILYIVVLTAMCRRPWFLPRADCNGGTCRPALSSESASRRCTSSPCTDRAARSRRSPTRTALGTSLAPLFWAYLLGRLIVAPQPRARWHLLRAREAAAASEPSEEPSADDR